MNALERRDQRAARCKTGGLLVFHHRGFRVGRIRSRFAVEVVIEPFRMSLIAGHVPAIGQRLAPPPLHLVFQLALIVARREMSLAASVSQSPPGKTPRWNRAARS